MDMKLSRIYCGKTMYWLSFLYYLFFIIFLTERMVINSDTLTNVISPIYKAVVIIICMIYLLINLYLRGSLYFNLMSFILFFLFFLGLSKGIIDYSETNLYYLASHISAGLTMVLFFMAGSNTFILQDGLTNLFKISSYIIVILYSVFIAIAYKIYLSSGLLGLQSFDLSLNIAPVLIPFVYFLVKKKYLTVIIPTILIFLSGKRALIVTLFFMLFLYMLFKRRKTKLKFVSILAVTVIILVCVLFIVVMYRSDNLTLLDSALKRISTLNILQPDEVNLDAISSGRINEILIVLETCMSSASRFLLGCGYGHFIPLEYESSLDHKIYYMEKIGFDVLPIHFTYLYGFVGAIILCSMIVVVLKRKYTRLKRMNYQYAEGTHGILTILLFVVAGILINSVFTFINPDPFLWFVFGLLCSKDIWKHYEHNAHDSDAPNDGRLLHDCG